jgi:hypothetical protein
LLQVEAAYKAEIINIAKYFNKNTKNTTLETLLKTIKAHNQT